MLEPEILTKVSAGENHCTMASDDPHVISITDVKDIDGNDPLDSEFYHHDDGLRTLGSAGELLTRVDLDLAYSSEKLLNLDILFMHVADRAGDCEALLIDNDDISGDSFEKALEFDILSGILYNEVKELDDFMIFLQEEIMDAREKISSCEHLKAAFAEMVEKLHDSEESLKQSQMQVSDMRVQSAKFQSTFVFGGLASWNSGFSEISQLSSMHTKVKMQTTDQQRHILKMLEKSLARELDLEKWLSESRHNEEELKLKLYYAEQEMEEMDLIMERLFEAESIAEVLKGISKELTGKLQIVHFKLSSSTKQEGKMRSMLQEDREKHSTENTELDNLKSDLKEAEDKYDRTNSEALSLREKVISLTENLKESASQLEEAKASVEENQVQQNILESKIIDLEKLMEALRENLLKSESRADSAEIQCKLLTEDRLKLEQELGSLRGNNTEKVNLLEKQLRQSETQLQHAKASVEASQEQQKMLYSTLNDMENLIKDLKEKSLKAERRAENAEAKCISLTETNLELNEELGFLRGRAEFLEMSLHQANDVKMETAKDIGVRTKVISNLVMQLAMERKRLHTQISSLTKENSVLVEKLSETRKETYVFMSHNGSTNEESILPKDDGDGAGAGAQCSLEESVNTSDALSVKADKFAKDVSQPAVSAENTACKEPNLGTVRTIEAGQLNRKLVFLAAFILLIAAVAYIFQLESCPF